MNDTMFRLDEVRMVRRMIESKLFTHEQINIVSSWLGFNDTSYKEKTDKGKLNDFLLNEEYWKKRLNK